MPSPGGHEGSGGSSSTTRNHLESGLSPLGGSQVSRPHIPRHNTKKQTIHLVRCAVAADVMGFAASTPHSHTSKHEKSHDRKIIGGRTKGMNPQPDSMRRPEPGMANSTQSHATNKGIEYDGYGNVEHSRFAQQLKHSYETAVRSSLFTSTPSSSISSSSLSSSSSFPSSAPLPSLSQDTERVALRPSSILTRLLRTGEICIITDIQAHEALSLADSDLTMLSTLSASARSLMLVPIFNDSYMGVSASGEFVPSTAFNSTSSASSPRPPSQRAPLAPSFPSPCHLPPEDWEPRRGVTFVPQVGKTLHPASLCT